jgi:hypothetical protein
MIRLASSRSRVALFALWILTVATFADAANLDDFLGSAVVLHDDQDVTSAASQQFPPQQNAPAPDPAKKPAGPSCIVIDQDSPSLEAPVFTPGLVPGVIAVTERPLFIDLQLSRESLHIKFRTLII